MQLIRCPNCLSVYGDVQSACPACDADPEGVGAEVELDVTTRTAIARLGGVYGGILEAPGGRHLIWCETGVCLVENETGFRWHANLREQVDGLSFDEEAIRAETKSGDVLLGWEDGAQL